MANDRILTAEQEMKLRQPIDDYIGKIQKKIDSLRADGTDQVVTLQNTIDGIILPLFSCEILTKYAKIK